MGLLDGVDEARQVLLGRRNGDPGCGLWDIPVGFLGEETTWTA